MDAVEYLRTFYRMCDSNKYCSSCEAVGVCQHDCEKAEQMVEIVEKWEKEHRVKTRATKLLEAFPNADVYDGIPDVCPKRLDKSFEAKCGEQVRCEDCEREFWTEEIE